MAMMQNLWNLFYVLMEYWPIGLFVVSLFVAIFVFSVFPSRRQRKTLARVTYLIF